MLKSEEFSGWSNRSFGWNESTVHCLKALCFTHRMPAQRVATVAPVRVHFGRCGGLVCSESWALYDSVQGKGYSTVQIGNNIRITAIPHRWTSLARRTVRAGAWKRAGATHRTKPDCLPILAKTFPPRWATSSSYMNDILELERVASSQYFNSAFPAQSLPTYTLTSWRLEMASNNIRPPQFPGLFYLNGSPWTWQLGPLYIVQCYTYWRCYQRCKPFPRGRPVIWQPPWKFRTTSIIKSQFSGDIQLLKMSEPCMNEALQQAAISMRPLRQ